MTLSPSSVILVYDSLYDSIDSETAQIILNLFANNHLKFEMVNVYRNKLDSMTVAYSLLQTQFNWQRRVAHQR